MEVIQLIQQVQEQVRQQQRQSGIELIEWVAGSFFAMGMPSYKVKAHLIRFFENKTTISTLQVFEEVNKVQNMAVKRLIPNADHLVAHAKQYGQWLRAYSEKKEERRGEIERLQTQITPILAVIKHKGKMKSLLKELGDLGTLVVRELLPNIRTLAEEVEEEPSRDLVHQYVRFMRDVCGDALLNEVVAAEKEYRKTVFLMKAAMVQDSHLYALVNSVEESDDRDMVINELKNLLEALAERENQ